MVVEACASNHTILDDKDERGEPLLLLKTFAEDDATGGQGQDFRLTGSGTLELPSRPSINQVDYHGNAVYPDKTQSYTMENQSSESYEEDQEVFTSSSFSREDDDGDDEEEDDDPNDHDEADYGEVEKGAHEQKNGYEKVDESEGEGDYEEDDYEDDAYKDDDYEEDEEEEEEDDDDDENDDIWSAKATLKKPPRLKRVVESSPSDSDDLYRLGPGTKKKFKAKKRCQRAKTKNATRDFEVSDEPESNISDSDGSPRRPQHISYEIPFVPHDEIARQIDLILAKRESPRDEFLVKWKQRSYLDNTWLSKESIIALGGQRKLQNFELGCLSNLEDRENIDIEGYKIVERIIDDWNVGESGEKFYLCKWNMMLYTDCTWEAASLIESHYQELVDEFYFRSHSGGIPSCPPNHHKRATFKKLSEPPEYLKRCGKLRDYQLEAVNWLCYSWCHGNNVILADEMGLGKTIQSISYISTLVNEYNFTGPVLVVVPLSTIAAWQKEFSRWAPDLNTLLYIGDSKSRGIQRFYEWFAAEQTSPVAARPRHSADEGAATKPLPLFHVLVTTYELVLKDQQYLEEVDWRLLVVDEGHRLKNASSQLHSVLDAIAPYSRLLVTGTPLQNSLKELWSLLHFLMPEKFPDYDEFMQEYGSNDSNQVSGEKLEDLHRILKPHLLRRMKRDVEASLPAKVERILRIELTEEQKNLSRLVITKNYRELASQTKSVGSLNNILVELKKVCNHPMLLGFGVDAEGLLETREGEILIHSSGKMMILDQLMRRLYQDGHRVLIFSQMVKMLNVLESYLQMRKWKFQRLDGGVSSEARKRSIASFNAPGSDDFCFLLSTRAGGLGINLETADTVIIYDSDWNPQNDLQAMARAHRIGQTRSVNIYRFVCKNSVEETILERAKKKMILDHLVIQSMDSSSKGNKFGGDPGQGKRITRDELQSILKFGAVDLFKGEQKASKFDLDDLLARADSIDQANPPSGTAEPGFFDQFKVADFEIDDWSKIIPEDEVHKAESAIAEEEQMKKDMVLQEALLTTASKRKNRGPKDSIKGGRSPERVPSPQQGSISNKVKLSKDATRALIMALLKYGVVLDRFPTITKEVQSSITISVRPEHVKQAMIFLLQQINDTNAESSKLSNSVHVNLSQLRERHRLLSFLHEKITPHLGDLDTFSLIDEKGIKSVAMTGTHRWMIDWKTYEDDALLLIGVYKHGFGEWLEIANDESLGLSERLQECLVRHKDDQKFLPKELHLSRRVENVISHLIRNSHEAPSHKAVASAGKRVPEKPLGNSKRKPPRPLNDDDAQYTRKGQQTIQENGPPTSQDDAAQNTAQGTAQERPISRKGDEHFKEMRRLLKPARDEISFIAGLTADSISSRLDRVCEALFEIGNTISATGSSTDRLWEYLANFWPTEITGQELHRFYHKISKERHS